MPPLMVRQVCSAVLAVERGRSRSLVEPPGSAFSYRALGEKLKHQRAWIGHLRRRGISYASFVVLAAIFAWRTMILGVVLGTCY